MMNAHHLMSQTPMTRCLVTWRIAASTPKASPMVPPGEVSTPATERKGVANFVVKPNRKAKASGKKRVKKTAKK